MIHLKLLLIILCCLIIPITAEFYLSIVKLKILLNTQEAVLKHLDHYISVEEKRLNLLKRRLDVYRKDHINAARNVIDYLGSPTNAFTLIKRLTSDLQDILNAAHSSSVLLKKITQIEDYKYPTYQDLIGSVEAIVRLQDIYDLETTYVAQGVLDGIKNGYSLSADDCFELGRVMFYQKDYQNSLSWMLEGLEKYKDDTFMQLIPNERQIREDINMIYYLLEVNKKEMDFVTYVSNSLSLPFSELKNLSLSHHECHNNLWKKKHLIDDEYDPGYLHTDYHEEDKTIYKALCSGKMQVAPGDSKSLKCYYATKNHPFLKLAPFKSEQLHMDPNIFLFYDVISDDEIEILKKLSIPKLKQALVVGSQATKFRISVSAWLRDNVSPVIARISQRVSDMTGLDASYSEDLQVGNYGPGGHYEIHYDFFYEKPLKNRLATLMFYMSEVDQGGATVFTKLGLSILPVKNSAVFWLNLHPSGEGDLATRHAACPVLKGSKWVANKWIHNVGQELVQPCII